MADLIRYPYKLLSQHVTRPIIRVEIALGYKQDGVPCEVLVDSGADFCVFKAEIGEILGLDIKSGQEHVFVGVGGDESKGYAHTVWLAIDGNWISVDGIFSYDLPKGSPQIVGQRDFFDNFVVTFDRAQSTVLLSVNK